MGAKMIQLRPYQAEAVRSVYQYLENHDDNPCVVMPTGCHAKDHPILMYDGTVRKVQDVRVGDLVMGADSTPRCVLSLAHGHEQMARITPVKGESFVVNMGHILSLVSTNEGKKDIACYQKGGEITNVTVRDYLTKAKSWRHLRKLYRVPVEFSNKTNLPIPPHILGLLLGDGSMTYCVGFTTADEELGDEFIEYVESIGCSAEIRENDKGVPTYYASTNIRGESNPLLDMLSNLGLRGHTAVSKYIPQMYLTASRNDRLQLLAGLIDSDGYYDGHCLDFVTKSLFLANDILFLARSLGFMANYTEKYASCQTGAGGWYYRVHLSGDFNVLPCRRKRHVFNKRLMKKDVLRTGFSVEILPEDDYYGFELDGDHLYVDGNFFVHHNTGKSLVIAQIATDAVCRWCGRVLVLAHVKELLEQNAGKIKALCEGIEVGVYSAGLNSRDTDTPILVAGIQSIYNKADIIGKFDLIIIDEAHCIAPDGEGMYRTFLLAMQKKNPLLRVIGFTATPYRMKGGLICKPENILNKICYEVGIKEMIAHGYLSPLISYAGKAEADLSSMHIRGGEFIADEVEKAMDEEWLVVSACREIYEKTMDRKSVLIFTSSVKHCRHVVKILSEMAHQEVAIVTGDTPPDERAEILDRFKGVEIKDLLGDAKPPLKFLCNVNVLTTGFDAPNVDCIALLRPTNSPGLLVQMIGRGFRLSPETGKKNCLILDYGENIMRHGPIDCIRIHEREKGNGKAPAKMCPECRALVHASYSICPECGFVFPVNNRNIKISPYASHDGVLSGQITYEEYEVLDVSYEIHHKRGDSSAPPTLQVNYRVGLYQFKHEWVCPEHSGYARQKFEKWWYMRAAVGVLAPATVEEALSMARDGLLAEPKKIRVQIVSGEKYERIVKVELGERPRFTPVEADEEIPF